jgi:hypothetical protein
MRVRASSAKKGEARPWRKRNVRGDAVLAD